MKNTYYQIYYQMEMQTKVYIFLKKISHFLWIMG